MTFPFNYAKSFLLLVMFFLMPANFLPQARLNSDSKLLETGGAGKPSDTKTVPTELKIVSYNIRWRSGDELHEISQRLKSSTAIGGAAIIALQEVDRNKKRSGNANTARALAEELGMNYAWAAPPAIKGSDEEETGVAVLSPYPLTDITRIVLPNEGPGGRRRVALGATITIGPRTVRFYSVHAETRIALSKKLQQMEAVLADLHKYPKAMTAIVAGDFNTWEANALEETANLFTKAGLVTPFPDDELTFRTKVLITIELKLDWIWLRGFESTSFGIDRTIEVSDHWPLWTVVKATEARP